MRVYTRISATVLSCHKLPLRVSPFLPISIQLKEMSVLQSFNNPVACSVNVRSTRAVDHLLCH